MSKQKTPPNHGKPWTRQQEAQIRIQAAVGATTPAIARDLGRSEEAVRDRAAEKGITLKPIDKPRSR